jgi:hypothetical protein
VAVAFVVTTYATAQACSLEQRPQPVRIVPGAQQADVPSNVVFSPPAERGGLDADQYFWTIDGRTVALELDQEATEFSSFDAPFDTYSTNVYRPIAPLQTGDVIATCYRDSCDSGHSTVSDVLDDTPPSRPVLEDVEVTLYDAPSKGAGTFCPELDFIQIELSANDDTTPLEMNRVLIYTGDTPDEVARSTQPSIAVSGELVENSANLRIESWLGLDSNRDTRYSPLVSEDEVCFSLALMDWAGNIGERSAVECVDTRDPSAPYATVVEGAGCGCYSQSSQNHAPIPLLLLLAAGCGLRITSKQRRRA